MWLKHLSPQISPALGPIPPADHLAESGHLMHIVFARTLCAIIGAAIAEQTHSRRRNNPQARRTGAAHGLGVGPLARQVSAEPKSSVPTFKRLIS
jgi:hypothetical protein